MDCIVASIARGGIDVGEDCCRIFVSRGRVHRALKGNARPCFRPHPPQGQCRLRPRRSLLVEEGYLVQVASDHGACSMLDLKGPWKKGRVVSLLRIYRAKISSNWNQDMRRTGKVSASFREQSKISLDSRLDIPNHA